ncbi:MAG: glycosyltransferase [Myxococcales bacterium]|nr:glycosyltransferase [Myxococcales bacterium]
MSPQPEPATAERPCVGIYSYGFLAESMTFVYHQIVGVLDRFRPIVFTTRTENRDFFPYEPVVPSGFHPIRRVANNAIYNATGRVASLSSKQTALWRDVGRDAGVRLVHAHFGPGGIQAMAIADALDVPLLVTFHGYDASKALRFAAYRRSLIALFERADVIVVSNAMAEKLREHGTHKARVHVVHCGFSPDRFEVPERKSIRDKVADDETIEFLQVSSFAEKKGHRFTCEAFAAHHRRHPRSRLTLLGDGKARAKLEAHTHRLGIADAVEFAGWVAPDVVAQYKQHADVFLHHSVTLQNGDQEASRSRSPRRWPRDFPSSVRFTPGSPSWSRMASRGSSSPSVMSAPTSIASSGTSTSESARERASSNTSTWREVRALGDIYARLIENAPLSAASRERLPDTGR